MNKVYIVLQNYWSETSIIAIYLNEKEANERRDKENTNKISNLDEDCFTVLEHEVIGTPRVLVEKVS